MKIIILYVGENMIDGKKMSSWWAERIDQNYTTPIQGNFSTFQYW